MKKALDGHIFLMHGVCVNNKPRKGTEYIAGNRGSGFWKRRSLPWQARRITMKYCLPDRDNVEIPALTFRIPVNNAYTGKVVNCLAKGPFIADFVWDFEQEQYVCDRLYLKKNRVRLDDVAGMVHLVHAASWWAQEHYPINENEWECVA